MPTLPRPIPSLRRPIARPSAMPPANEPSDPVILESAGLRWINVTRPRLADQEWLDARFGFHPLDFEDVYSRNQRPKLDAYDDYLFIVLHFPVFDPAAARLNTAELDLFVGPDYLVSLPNDPIPPLEAMFVRFSEREDLREQTFSKGSGYLLYKLVDACVDASFPMLRKIGLRLERIEDDIFEGRSSEIVRDISEAKQEMDAAVMEGATRRAGAVAGDAGALVNFLPVGRTRVRDRGGRGGGGRRALGGGLRGAGEHDVAHGLQAFGHRLGSERRGVRGPVVGDELHQHHDAEDRHQERQQHDDDELFRGLDKGGVFVVLAHSHVPPGKG